MGRASKYIRNIPVLGRARGNSLEGWRIVPQIAAIMGIFSVSLYAVTSSYRNRTNMLALLLPPLITLCLILTQYLWVNSSILTAIFGSLSTIGVAALIVMNGFAMSKAFHAERLSAIMLKASEKNIGPPLIGPKPQASQSPSSWPISATN